ncbi:MAG: TVP38/TMEM64 family protein, partial [Alphaproteobacteria bacterium]|nr:TVP38/TMEM64 family protein [Alphaproteobacteria bacterium]
MTGDSTTSYSDSEAPPPKALWWRLLPAALLLGALTLALLLGIDDYLSFEALRDNRALLLEQVARLGILAGLVYIVMYIVVVALSFPGAIFLTLSGGFLFGAVEGAFYSVIGATLGAT